MTASEESATQLTCPNCGQPVWPDDNFCEACSAELSPPVTSGDHPEPTTRQCPNCSGSAITPEGYCEACGCKLPSGNDHVELELDLVAGVTDRGVRHSRNEDAMALATTQSAHGPVALAVVCDGVSTSSNPDEASQAASQAALQVLLAAVRSDADLAESSVRAVRAAQKALDELADTASLRANAPSATFVSAVATGKQVTVCWLGDSRAYWIDASGAASSRQLTVDDSVAQELVSRGLATEAEALALPSAHVVTGWIGADAEGAEPHVAAFIPEGTGAVLLCSDGLWNYQPDVAGLAEMALPDAVESPLRASAALVKFAIEQGGSDNVTVVFIPFPPRTRVRPGDTSEFAATDTTAVVAATDRAATDRGDANP
jgi:serine/threonine protein phosphatase PrpC